MMILSSTAVHPQHFKTCPESHTSVPVGRARHASCYAVAHGATKDAHLEKGQVIEPLHGCVTACSLLRWNMNACMHYGVAFSDKTSLINFSCDSSVNLPALFMEFEWREIPASRFVLFSATRNMHRPRLFLHFVNISLSNLYRGSGSWTEKQKRNIAVLKPCRKGLV